MEARAEEMLEVPQEWNEVPDLMMEEEDILPEDTGSTKQWRDEISRGRRKQRKEKKTISGRRNEDTRPQYHGGYKIQRDSILKIGTKISKRKTIGKCLISGRKFQRWCFITEYWRFIR